MHVSLLLLFLHGVMFLLYFGYGRETCGNERERVRAG
jgi:hypothetical protein